MSGLEFGASVMEAAGFSGGGGGFSLEGSHTVREGTGSPALGRQLDTEFVDDGLRIVATAFQGAHLVALDIAVQVVRGDVRVYLVSGQQRVVVFPRGSARMVAGAIRGRRRAGHGGGPITGRDARVRRGAGSGGGGRLRVCRVARRMGIGRR